MLGPEPGIRSATSQRWRSLTVTEAQAGFERPSRRARRKE